MLDEEALYPTIKWRVALWSRARDNPIPYVLSGNAGAEFSIHSEAVLKKIKFVFVVIRLLCCCGLLPCLALTAIRVPFWPSYRKKSYCVYLTV